MDEFTIGNSDAAVNLADILDKASPYRKRKVLRTLNEFNIIVSGIQTAKCTREHKQRLLTLIYHDVQKNMYSGIPEVKILTHSLNVLKTKHREVLRQIKA